MEACDLFRQLVAGKHVPVSLLKETVTFEIWFSFKYRHLLSDPEAFRKTMPLKLHDINPEDYTLFCDTLGIRQD